MKILKISLLVVSLVVVVVLGVLSACPPSLFHSRWPAHNFWANVPNIYAAVASRDGRLAVAVRQNGKVRIQVNDGNSGWREVTNGLLDADPAWSPSGRRIAYVSLISDGKRALRFVDLADGSTTTLLVRPSISQPRWSPDSRSILFLDDTNQKQKCRVCEINIDTKITKQTVAQPDTIRPETWQLQGNGDRIACISDGSVWLGSRETGTEKKISASFNHPCMIQTSPNERLLYVCTSISKWNKPSYLVDLLNNKVVAVSANDPRCALWSPSGRYLALPSQKFTYLLANNSDLKSVQKYKSLPKINGTAVCWMSDSKLVLIAPDVRAPHQLETFDVKTGQRSQIFPE